MVAGTPLVTVCVPAYNSRDLIAPTLDSLAGQTFGDFRVILSVDLGSDDTAAYLDAATPDDRFVVRRRARHLGWAGNVNATLDEVTTPFACIVAHDDTVTPNYLAELVAALEGSPDCAYAMPAAIARGRVHRDESPRPLRGHLGERIADWVARSTHEALLPWRALVRREVLDAGLRLRGSTEFLADRLWALDLVIAGEGAIAPHASYVKDVRDTGLVRSWEGEKAESRADHLGRHLGEVIGTLHSVGLPDVEADALSGQYAQWVTGLGGHWSLGLESDAGGGAARAVARFVTSAVTTPRPTRTRTLPRVAATMVVRDQAELLSLNLDHHLALGVEHVFVTDHSSGPETQSVLESAVFEGLVTVTRAESPAFEQETWCSAMAGRAYEGGYDWVVHLDADEFLWAPGMDVRTTLAGLPDADTVIRLPRWNVVPVRGSVHWSDSPMGRDLLSLNSTGRRIQPKVMHRACPDATVIRGNHAVTGTGLGNPVEVDGLHFLHVPLTTYEEFEAATSVRSAGLALDEPGASDRSAHWAVDARALRDGSLRAEFEARLPAEVHTDGVSRWQAELQLPRHLADLRAARAERREAPHG